MCTFKLNVLGYHHDMIILFAESLIPDDTMRSRLADEIDALREHELSSNNLQHLQVRDD